MLSEGLQSEESKPSDVLVIGCGPSAVVLASALVKRELDVHILAPQGPEDAWINTYGIWGFEVEEAGINDALSHSWLDTRSYFGAINDSHSIKHGLEYALIDNQKLRQKLLSQTNGHDINWHRGLASQVRHYENYSAVLTDSGHQLFTRLVVDASGHQSVFVKRPEEGAVAGQSAYGIVGTFNKPPVADHQFVMMDYRSDHLSEKERCEEAPSFLYAWDLGEGEFFVEETCLAHAPPLSCELLKDRLIRRLAYRQITVKQVHHEEFCRSLPMNLPLPDLQQRVLGFGVSAGMVHPSTGYMVGDLLRRAPSFADSIARGLKDQNLKSSEIAQQAWQALWPPELRRKRALYLFGIEKILRFSEDQLREFFETFFNLPREDWYGFLANSFSLHKLIMVMIGIFISAPWNVKRVLMHQRKREISLLTRVLKDNKQGQFSFQQ